MDMSPDRPFYVNVTNFSENEVYVKQHQKTPVLLEMPVKIGHSNDERFSYLSATHDINNEADVKTVHYKPTPDYEKQVEHH